MLGVNRNKILPHPHSVKRTRPGWALAVLLLASFLPAPWHAATASPVSADRATAAVTNWLGLDRMPLGESLGSSVQRLETFSNRTGVTLFHVVHLNPSGFVVVAGDDLVEPIIAF